MKFGRLSYSLLTIACLASLAWFGHHRIYGTMQERILASGNAGLMQTLAIALDGYYQDFGNWPQADHRTVINTLRGVVPRLDGSPWSIPPYERADCPCKISPDTEVIDAWGTSVRYDFPRTVAPAKVTSAGADRQFDTSDDLTLTIEPKPLRYGPTRRQYLRTLAREARRGDAE